jgi:hypothetical protein
VATEDGVDVVFFDETGAPPRAAGAEDVKRASRVDGPSADWSISRPSLASSYYAFGLIWLRNIVIF